MIEYRAKQLLIDGEPRVVMAGEVHYFRVAREEWEQRILLLKEAGCTAVASYIPWLFHQLPDGSIDVGGTTRPERDVAAFIDLCREHGLWFIARPGPFVMAELKNEGLPYRLYTEHPEIVPTGWDGAPAPSRTVDYLAPAYLTECERWYAAIMPLLAERLQPRGGNVIAVQLDNEIGMLAWVTNTPDLTEHLVADFGQWVRARGEAEADSGRTAYPVEPGSPAWAEAVRSPQEAWAGALRVDLARFMRDRFRRYVETLRAMAERGGVEGVPFLVNIHGTEGGSGESFPIGISQLVETYAGVPGVLSGSDHYMGDMTMATTTDLYVINAFMDAVHDLDQPTTSLEFEAGSGDYGGGLDQQYDPASVDLKTRRSVAQGNRLINYYLFAGGINPHLDEPVGDGNDRISFTGERHGTAAPVGPEGQRGMTYASTSAAVHAVNVHERWLARMREDHDPVQLGFVLDHYATEYHHTGSPLMEEVVADLRAHRGAGQRRALVRSLLLDGYRFPAVHLQRDEPAGVVLLATGRHLGEDVQQRLVRHVQGGGGLLLLGRLPDRDLQARPCTVLADALGLKAGEVVRDTGHFFPSAVARGWAAPWPETRVGWRQELVPSSGDVVLTDVTGAVCGVDVPLGEGRAVVLTAELPSSPVLFGRAMGRLGVQPGLAVRADVPGVFATTTSTDDGQRLLHVTNTTGHRPAVDLTLDGEPVNHGVPLRVPPRSGHMLALGLETGLGRVEWASAELAEVGTDRLVFHPGLGHEEDEAGTVVVLSGCAPVRPDAAHVVEQDGDRQVVRTVPGAAPERLFIRFA
ncbi:beta-galactosidase [Knoellia sp. p5-6-4]|uniref:beta-galactosidase n=1 Tax=unclassified Knoellia TaxID=2618719 RepID=UPI0023DB05B9|nr:beta-galactosidase [Knoellia sp. p5-6-4]MDF2145585.1 beta-galactosidase [Knoellia sp. p5-6-4]